MPRQGKDPLEVEVATGALPVSGVLDGLYMFLEVVLAWISRVARLRCGEVEFLRISKALRRRSGELVQMKYEVPVASGETGSVAEDLEIGWDFVDERSEEVAGDLTNRSMILDLECLMRRVWHGVAHPLREDKQDSGFACVILTKGIVAEVVVVGRRAGVMDVMRSVRVAENLFLGEDDTVTDFDDVVSALVDRPDPEDDDVGVEEDEKYPRWILPIFYRRGMVIFNVGFFFNLNDSVDGRLLTSAEWRRASFWGPFDK